MSHVLVGVLLLEQRPEARVVAEGVEQRVDAEPAGREVERDLEERFEQVESWLRLSENEMNADQLELIVRFQLPIVWSEFQPPPTVARVLPALFEPPPPTVESSPLEVLFLPPPMVP